MFNKQTRGYGAIFDFKTNILSYIPALGLSSLNLTKIKETECFSANNPENGENSFDKYGSILFSLIR